MFVMASSRTSLAAIHSVQETSEDSGNQPDCFGSNCTVHVRKALFIGILHRLKYNNESSVGLVFKTLTSVRPLNVLNAAKPEQRARLQSTSSNVLNEGNKFCSLFIERSATSLVDCLAGNVIVEMFTQKNCFCFNKRKSFKSGNFCVTRPQV